jgi:DNA-binding GntR family transcriptional regulator
VARISIISARPAPAPFAPIAVRTLADRVYDIVRDRILAGELAGGDPIRQDGIAAELGISKIPLREALTRLEQYGLVSSHANRGYVVSALTTEEAEELFALRLKLEPDAMLEGSRRATEADRVAAGQALAALNAQTEAGEVDHGLRNRSFHMALIEPGGGRITLALVERLVILSGRYVHLHLRPAGRASRAQAEHAELFACWSRGDLERLEQSCRAHIGETLADLRRQLS